MDNSAITQQLREEYQAGYDYIQPKRLQILRRLQKHIKQNKKEGMVNINMISNTIDTLIAGSYIDEPQAKFVSRDNLMESQQAETLNYMANFDSKEQNYQQLDYQVQRDRYFFGLGIKYKSGFDNVKKVPIFIAVNPMTGIFDPSPTLNGQFNANQHRFFGFTLRTSLFELKNDPQYSKEALAQLSHQMIDNDQELMAQAQAQSDNTNYLCDNLLFNFSVDVYHHYMIVDNRKTLVTVDSTTKTIILRNEPIKAVLKEEKENPALIGRPFAFYYYKPERAKVFGVSICDLLEDKEEAKTILINASLMKTRLEAFGGKFVVNTRLISNKKDILKPNMGTQYIFTNDKMTAEDSLDNVMRELPTSPIKQDVLTMTNMLEREGVMDSKQDQMQAGIVPDKQMTKAEQQSVQQNANMLSSLNIKTYLWGEYEFWFLRWRTYMEYFSSADEKFVLMNQDFEWRSMAVKRDTFCTKNNPFIITGSKSDLEAVNREQKAYWNATLPIIINDPAVPMVSKNLAKRFVAKLNGMPQNIINQTFPLTPDERQAISYVENFLNDDVIPKTLFDNPNADFLTYWIYFQKAENNESKEKVLDTLQKVLIDQGAMQDMQAFGQMNAQASSAGNILTSQLGQQQSSQNNIISKESVLNPNM